LSDSLTQNVGLTKPGIGASQTTWGSKLNDDLDLIDALLFFSVPVGAVVDFGGTTVPAGWLLCDGRTVSRTTYSDLFNAIATTFGIGDGFSTFALPDLRGRMVVGAGSGSDGTTSVSYTLGQLVGKFSVAIAQANLPNYQLAVSTSGAHAHGYTQLTAHNPAPSSGGGTIAYTAISHSTTTTLNTITDGSSAHRHSATLGGSSTPIDVTKPLLAVNRLIYAGKQAA